MRDVLNWLASEESGQGMVEYGLILALVSIAVVIVLGTMGGQLKAIFENVSGHLDTPSES